MNKITSEDKLIKECLLKSRHIALIGASVRQELAAYEVMKYLLEKGYKVFPVNPKYKDDSILGQKVFADLLDIPTSIDLVNVFRPAAEASALHFLYAKTFSCCTGLLRLFLVLLRFDYSFVLL